MAEKVQYDPAARLTGLQPARSRRSSPLDRVSAGGPSPQPDQLLKLRYVAQWRELLKDAFAAMPRPERARVFDALEVDDDGWLWVRRTPLPGDSLNRWDVFDPEGVFVAQALIPASLRVRQIGLDYVLAIRRDEWDLEQVVVYRLLRS